MRVQNGKLPKRDGYSKPLYCTDSPSVTLLFSPNLENRHAGGLYCTASARRHPCNPLCVKLLMLMPFFSSYPSRFMKLSFIPCVFCVAATFSGFYDTVAHMHSTKQTNALRWEKWSRPEIGNLR